ncbi:MAG: membrane dipeptidase [Paracoccaceae bacterium]
MSKKPLFIDNLQYSNWSPEVFKEMLEGNLTAVHVTICYHENFRQTIENIINWNKFVELYPHRLMLARSADDVRSAYKDNKTAIIFGFQNCSPIEENIGLIEILHKLGVRFMQLSYNNQSLLATGCYEENDPGITRFGKQAIKEMNRVGLVIDVSHTSENSSFDAIRYTERPIVISHANPTWWHESKRNKSHALIKEVTSSGGMIGFSIYPHHLKDGTNCTLESFSTMIAQSAEKYGVDNLGIGSDICQNQPDSVVEWMRNGTWSKELDYGEGTKDAAGFPTQPEWFDKTSDFPNLLVGLKKAGFNEEEALKIMGLNWLNFYEENFHAL